MGHPLLGFVPLLVGDGGGEVVTLVEVVEELLLVGLSVGDGELLLVRIGGWVTRGL